MVKCVNISTDQKGEKVTVKKDSSFSMLWLLAVRKINVILCGYKLNYKKP